MPARFLLFALIGGLGVSVHLAALWLLLRIFSLPFAAAQTIATVTAKTGLFLLNNTFTYRDRRLRGGRFVRGLFIFYLVCGVGAAANVGIASFIFDTNKPWWLAGPAGAIVSSVWNYALTSVYTWRT